MLQLCGYGDIKHLGSLESTQEAIGLHEVTLTLLCSPNFPRAQYLDKSTLMILKFTISSSQL